MYKLLFILLIFSNCTPKEEIIHPKAIAITVIGEVYSNGKKLNLSQEITDEDTISVGKSSICDLQLLDSDSLVVLRLKPFTKFQLSGKMIGSKKNNFFSVLFGTAIFHVSKVSENDGIQTKTPTTTAGVRGTKYEVNVTQNGSTTLTVLEGKVATHPRIPEIDQFSRSEIKSNKVLKRIVNTLEKKEMEVSAGESTQIKAEINQKIISDAGIKDSLKSKDSKEIGKDTDIDKMDKTLSELENSDSQVTKKTIDPNIMKQKLKEYEEITPFEKEKINDKQARKALILTRFQKIEKSLWDSLRDWLNGLKL